VDELHGETILEEVAGREFGEARHELMQGLLDLTAQPRDFADEVAAFADEELQLLVDVG
jgi:hypothetical protein